IVLIILFLLNILFLLLTINRGSIIGVLIGGVPLILLFLKYQKRVYKIIYSLLIVLVLLCVILNLPDTITNRFYEITTETNAFMKQGADEGSASTRLRIWQIVFSHSKEFWLLGNNPLYANQILHQYFVEAGHQDYVEFGYLAHNTYIAYWLKGGFLLLLLFLFLIIYPLIKMIRFHQYSYFVFSVLIFFTIVGIEDTYCETRYKPAILLLFFLFFITFLSQKLVKIEHSNLYLIHE
ncbi:MAG: O-antigen ligase family protein, partial [Chitinophagaceae bacterium]